MWKHKENILLKAGTCVSQEPQCMVTHLAEEPMPFFSVMPYSDYRKCHKSSILMHPLRMKGDPIYESANLGEQYTKEMVPDQRLEEHSTEIVSGIVPIVQRSMSYILVEYHAKIDLFEIKKYVNFWSSKLCKIWST